MPTGYTHKLCEGDQSFRDFIFTCARAMGACIALRDEPLSAELPDNVGFSDYHTGALEAANAEVLRLTAMSDDERLQFGRSQIIERVNSCEKSIAEAKATRSRLEGMLANVEAWTPPTSEHEGFKTFMQEQLTRTMEFDGDGSYYERELATVNAKKPSQVWEEALAKAKSDVEYHIKNGREDAKRNASRNEWVRQLKESVAA